MGQPAMCASHQAAPLLGDSEDDSVACKARTLF